MREQVGGSKCEGGVMGNEGEGVRNDGGYSS